MNLLYTLRVFSVGQPSGDVKLIFEYFGDDIDFEVEIEGEDDSYFRIDRINNPLALFEINAPLWFRGVSDTELEDAHKKMVSPV